MTRLAADSMAGMPPPPRQRAAATWSIVAAALAVLAAVGGGLLAVWARDADPSAISLGIAIAAVGVTGGVLILARPDNRIGWILAGAGAAWGLGEGIYDTGVRGLLITRSSPTIDAALLAGAPLRALGWLGAAVAVPALFPYGRLPSPRWRWLGWVLTAALATNVVGIALDASLEDLQVQATGWRSPVPASLSPVGDALASVSLPLVLVTVIGSVTALVRRFRHGDAALRRQLLLLGAAAALPLIVIPTAFGAGWPDWLFAASVAPLPVAIGVAILSGGIFDLATVANRALVWGVLTVSIVGLYAVVVTGTGELLGRMGGSWLPWLGTGVVAVCFAPLRSALQRTADQVTYGDWRRPYDVLAGLGPRIERSSGVEQALSDVVGALVTRLGLTGATLRDAAGRVVAGEPGPAAVALPLLAYGRHVGDLLYTEPATPLRPSDRRVLDDLAAQVALLMHARALTDDLLRARERLVLAREEERRRLRRDLHDGLGPALAGLMLKVDNARALVPGRPEAAAQDLLCLRDDIRDTVADVRRLVEGLRPPALDELGLAAALAQAVHRIGSQSPTAVELIVAEDLPTTPAAVEVAAYRIVSEAVANAVRHAGATHCDVELCVDGSSLLVRVSDDGHGIDDRRVKDRGTGNGLITMRERAEELGGSLTVRSSQRGTSVTAHLPLASVSTGDGS
jgi:signal transduction histidine kinase